MRDGYSLPWPRSLQVSRTAARSRWTNCGSPGGSLRSRPFPCLTRWVAPWRPTLSLAANSINIGSLSETPFPGSESSDQPVGHLQLLRSSIRIERIRPRNRIPGRAAVRPQFLRTDRAQILTRLRVIRARADYLVLSVPDIFPKALPAFQGVTNWNSPQLLSQQALIRGCGSGGNPATSVCHTRV